MVANAGICSEMNIIDGEPLFHDLWISVEYHNVARPQPLWIIGIVPSLSTRVESFSATSMLVYK